ncbi:MAG: DUF3307 domain-containing protein [Verrucomicrobiae bacterium]|nr:DUF3307 domain-containing protein [Verrucomicrobiae bacterium]
MIESLPVENLDFVGALVLFFALCIGHALADFPLQGEFLSRGKNRHLPPPPLADGDSSPKHLWVYLMSAHALTHAGFVWIITGSPLLGFAEFVIHFAIDSMKCEKLTGFETDQWLHIATKAVYVGIIWAGLL